MPELDGRTPLEVARIPHIDWIAQHGRMGRAITVPDGFTPATDVATLSLFGYAPSEYYTGRAPMEAAAQGLTVGPDETIFRCNFVTVTDGRMADFTAGHIPQEETDPLVEALKDLFADEGLAFHAGISYRNLMVTSGFNGSDPKCAPPHDIHDQRSVTTGLKARVRIASRR